MPRGGYRTEEVFNLPKDLTIERLAARGVIVRPASQDKPCTDWMGQTRITELFVFSGEQG